MFIVTKKIDSENISKLCRTCLREDGDKMVYLFVGPAGSSLAAKLRSLSCLEVWQGDGLPEKMCDRCVTRAESALLYREQCRAADRALRQAALKMAGVTSYTTVSGCKLFQENQGFVPIQNFQKTLKCVECGAVFMNYQELLAHNKLHLPFYEDNNLPLHVFESYMGYSNFSSQSYNPNPDHPAPSFVKSNSSYSNPMSITSPEKNACNMHNSLISPPTSKVQSNHSYSQNTDNIDVSCDEEQIEITDSNYYHRNDVNCEGSIHQEMIDDFRFPSQNLDLNNLSKSDIQLPVNPLHIPQNDGISKVETNDKDKVETLPKVKEKKYKCEQCTKSFAEKSKLRSHMLTHSGIKPFGCSKCDKAYASKSKLNAHMRLHSRTNVHRCRICDKEFAYPSYLKEHSKVHESKPDGDQLVKPFECAICRKKFQLEKSLATHMRLHTGKDVFSCEICDKKFGRKYGLKAHLKMHQMERSNKCDHCDKSFSQRSNLVEHMRIHTKTKPFACDICGKCFAQSSHLKTHKATHNNSRLYQCRICGKRFKLPSHLKRHMNLHSGNKLFKCDDCNQLFSHAFSLKRHSKKHSESG